MKCIICGKQAEKILCKVCIENANEELCYKICDYDYYNSDNDLWKELSDGLEKPYLFKNYAFDVADLIGKERSEFIKINIANRKSPYLGVPKDYRDNLLNNEKKLLVNDALNETEKNLIKALVLEVNVSRKNWDKVYSSVDDIKLDKVYVEPYLILADYYTKIRKYEMAKEILEKSKEIFKDNKSVYRINSAIKECDERYSGTKKPWKPGKSEEIREFEAFLDKIGVEYETRKAHKSGAKKKIAEKDFKPYNYFEGEIPNQYVVLWMTSEFYLKRREIVEINAYRVCNGKIIDDFHSFVKPLNTIRKIENVNPKDIEDAKHIREVFPEFLEYLGDDVIAVAGFVEQKQYLSRLARYSMMDSIENKVFDVVEYGEDVLDDAFTRESLLRRLGLEEGKTGLEKAKVTMKMVEKIRGL